MTEETKYATFQGKICITYHNDKNYQVFETENGSFVYDKKAELVYKLTLEGFNRMLIKLAALIPVPIIRPYNFTLNKK